MKLYHHPFSSNARKAVMTQKMLGLPAELIFVDLAKGEHMKPDFVALNPNHAVPVLVDGDFVLTESHAIMAYLCEVAGDTTLYPAERQARAKVHQWLFWCANHLGPAVAGLNFEHNLKKLFGQGEADPAQVARHETFFHRYAAVLDGALATHEWLTGALSLADLAVAAPLMYVQAAKLPLGEYTHVLAWRARVAELPAWRETNPF